MPKEIPLSKGKVAVIDDCDYHRLSEYEWYCLDPPKSKTFYAARNLPGGGMTSMHRAIMGDPDGKCVDHVDGDGLNNRRENLRVCSHKENIRAQRPQEGRSSQYRGVSWYKRLEKWRAAIKVDGKEIWLGVFREEDEAAEAYDRAALKHFGEFAYTNIL